MKKIILIISVAAAFSACKKSNNTQTTTPVHAVDTLMSWTKSAKLFNDIEDIWFTSSGTGFLLGDTSIYESSDRGVSWMKTRNTSGVHTFNLQFLNDQAGFAQSSSTIEVTTDGGKTWNTKKLVSSNAIYSQFVSQQIGFYADIAGGILKTVDGGNTWNQVLGYQNQNRRFPFYFTDSVNGFTMADGNFSNTTDGGIHWQLKASAVDPSGGGNFYKMQMFDTLTGFSGTSQGLLKTVDGGRTWTNTLRGSSGFIIFQFIDRDHGYTSMNNSIFKTTDGGSTWNLSCRLATSSFSGIHLLDMDHVWACTFDGYILTLN